MASIAALYEEQVLSQAASSVPVDMARLNFQQQSVFRFFASLGHPLPLLSLLEQMDGVDEWALDFNLNDRPDRLAIGVILDQFEFIVNRHVGRLHAGMPHMLAMLSHLTTSRCIYLLHFVSQKNPEFMTAFLDAIENERASNLDADALYKRLNSFFRSALLSRIFSGERLKRITKILGSHRDEI